MRRQLLFLLLPFCVFTSNGCIAFYSYQPTHIIAVDAETGARLPGVKVTPEYYLDWPPRFLIINPPDRTPVVTDKNGEAVIRAASIGDLNWDAEVQGFMSGREHRPLEKPPSEIVFHLYGEPVPIVRIIVPHNYRGPVMVHWRKTPGFVQESVGKRIFEFCCSADGYVAIDATPMLWEHSHDEICDEDGTRYKSDESFWPDTVLAWYIGSPLFEKGSERKALWVIGTASDESAMRDRVVREFGGLFGRGSYYQHEAATDSLFKELSHAPASSPSAR